MNKFRNVPAIITLLAAFITCVIMIMQRYELVNFLWVLVLVIVCFYVFGLLVRFVLNKVFKTPQDEEEENNDENTEEGAESDTLNEEENQDSNAE